MRIEAPDFDFQWRRAHPFPWKGRNVCFFGTSSHDSTQTTVNNSTPWAPQQPYLEAGFSQAQNLLNQAPPQQQNPVVPFNSPELASLSAIVNQAGNGTPIVSAANNFDTALQSGAFLNSNPSLGYFGSLAGTNLGTSAPGASTLAEFANGGGNGAGTLAKYANGGYFSGNNYADPTAQSIMSQVIPQVAASFNGGNNINNPAAAFAAGQGVTNALAPLEYQNYTTQEQLQQGAAQQEAANQLAGASGATNAALSGGNLQATAAEGISQPFQQTLTSMVQGNALAPANQSLSYSDLMQALNAGQTIQQQAQNEAQGQAATYNFSQLSPYQQLQAYMQAVTGSYGGQSTGSQTTPYYTNDTANTLGAISGAASLAATIIPFL